MDGLTTDGATTEDLGGDGQYEVWPDRDADSVRLYLDDSVQWAAVDLTTAEARALRRALKRAIRVVEGG